MEGCAGGTCFGCHYASNSAVMSAFIWSMVATILVVFVVWVLVSSCSMYLILFLRFSSLKLYAYKMSRRSIGVGEGFEAVVAVFASAGDVAVPRAFRIVDKCGSFFAFCADPSTKTNLLSKSSALYCNARSLVASSTLIV